VVPTCIGVLAILTMAASAGPIAVAQSRSAAASPGGSRTAPPAATPALSSPVATQALVLPATVIRIEPAAERASDVVPAKPRMAAPAPRSTVAARAGRGSTAVFLGDSYTSGWQGAGIGAHGWPQMVGRERAWRVLNLAVPGTGFLNPGWTSQPVGSLVSRAVARHPDVVVIAAGHNDSRWSAAATESAADRVIARVHRSLPGAVIVVIGPIWANGSPPTRCLALRDHLRRTAAAIGAVFVDPIGERWFAGSRHRMIRADGIHPDNAGHRWIAARVLAALARNDV
jgi:lysophospholipase L1-like esterase